MTDLDRALGISDQPPPSGEEELGEQQARLDGLRLCLYESADLERIPPPVPLVDRWLNIDSLAWLFGERGHRKSFTALDLAGCVAGGLDWHGYATKQAHVLYVMCEGVGGLHARVRAWEDYHQAGHEAVFLAARPPLHIIRDGPALGSLAAELDAGLIVIDTQNRATVGLDENSNVDMGRMIAALDGIREQCRACILMVHHSAIGTHRPRGHGSIDGAASVMIRVASDGNLVKIENGKQREDERSASLMLAATPHAGSMVLTHSSEGGMIAATESEATIRRCLRDLLASKGNVTHADLKRACLSFGMGDGTFNYYLRRQIETGSIVRMQRNYNLANPAQALLNTEEEADPRDEQ